MRHTHAFKGGDTFGSIIDRRRGNARGPSSRPSRHDFWSGTSLVPQLTSVAAVTALKPSGYRASLAPSYFNRFHGAGVLPISQAIVSVGSIRLRSSGFAVRTCSDLDNGLSRDVLAQDQAAGARLRAAFQSTDEQGGGDACGVAA